MTVDILLATYNGATFLTEQIDSILNQSYEHWTLLIRDDLSNDATLEIINEYLLNYPEKIKLFKSNARFGTCQNFNYLLQKSSADYVMFCDQDDIWLREKIQLSLDKMKTPEKEYPDVPILIHTDLKIIAADNRVIANSFWEAIKLNPDKRDIIDLLGTSNTNGNTIMMNKRLREIIGFIPDKAIMHDWWSAIVAAKFGLIIPLKKPTVLYRQHGKNAVGANSIFHRLPSAHIYLSNIHTQILAFEKRYNLKYSRLKIYGCKALNLIKNHIFPYKNHE